MCVGGGAYFFFKIKNRCLYILCKYFKSCTNIFFPFYISPNSQDFCHFPCFGKTRSHYWTEKKDGAAVLCRGVRLNGLQTCRTANIAAETWIPPLRHPHPHRTHHLEDPNKPVRYGALLPFFFKACLTETRTQAPGSRARPCQVVTGHDSWN